MSSLRGEQALKDGISFEFTWAARHLIEVMEERADAIMLGGMPGEAGVDFRLYFPDREEHHQVKRAHGTHPDWTLAALAHEGVLSDFRQRLEDPKVHCYMVSGIPATPLGYLANRARESSDFASYEAHYLTREYEGWFNDLVHRWDSAKARAQSDRQTLCSGSPRPCIARPVAFLPVGYLLSILVSRFTGIAVKRETSDPASIGCL